MKQFNKTKNSFSLIEVCISIVVITTILVSMLLIINQGYRQLRSSRLRTIACFLAQEKMEANYKWQPNADSEDYETIIDFPDFKRVCTVVNGPITPTELKKITVTVYWQGQSGEQSLSIVSLKTDY